MTRRAVLPVGAVFSVVVAACAVPTLTPQQSAQYCAVDVHGPSGAPVFAQSALALNWHWELDSGAETRLLFSREVTRAGRYPARFVVQDAQGLACSDNVEFLGLASGKVPPRIVTVPPASASCGGSRRCRSASRAGS